MPTYRGGRHEHGQNYLADHQTIATIARLIERTRGPIIEIGPGRGALTRTLQRLDRPLTAVEIDSGNIGHLRSVLSPTVDIVHADFLSWHLPTHPHVVVGNVPFSLTTAILRKLLHAPGWTGSVLLVQWEVARRRAGVGGATMMTAQWWPWVEFGVQGRVPRTVFRPVPSTDGGLLVMERRSRPLVRRGDRSAYRRFVHSVFTGRGNGIAVIVARLVHEPVPAVKARLAREGIRPSALPKDLSAAQWVALFEAARSTGRRLSRTGR